MGMFDSVMLEVKCPYCGTEKELDLQTKEFSCRLAVWRKGDFIDSNTKGFDTIAECLEQNCPGVQPMPKTHIGDEYTSRFFYAHVYLKRGRVTGKYKIIPE